MPAYVVHFTQAAAVEHANSLQTLKAVTREEKDAIAELIGGFRFGTGFGKTLSKLVRNGIGVHHAGMLPRYRRLVEQLAQAGLLKVICGTDTLGVGINVPIRTVLFTGLAKFDGSRQRVLRTREFLQIAGRAGRAGFDTAGYVVVQAPEHVIDNEKAKAKSEAKNAGQPQEEVQAAARKPPEGTVVWSEQTFEKLVAGVPEQLVSRMKIDNAMLLNVRRPRGGRVRGAAPAADRQPRGRARAGPAGPAGAAAGPVAAALRDADPARRARRVRPPVRADRGPARWTSRSTSRSRTSRWPRSTCSTRRPRSTPSTSSRSIEAVLEAPRQILFAQQHQARGEAVAEMKADGLEYDERMALLDQITWPQPLAELLEAAYEIYRQSHPWLREDGLEPKSVVREMYEQAMTFTDFVGRYQLARSEGLVLRYLTDAYRTLRHTVPEAHRTPELEDLVEWLGETVRQTDSSLLDEWEALTDPDAPARAGGRRAAAPAAADLASRSGSSR